MSAELKILCVRAEGQGTQGGRCSMAAVDLKGREAVTGQSSLLQLKVKIAEFPEEHRGGKSYPAFPLSATTSARPKLALPMRNSVRG
jgi:hypothetical protein